jgi:hypothetical protein
MTSEITRRGGQRPRDEGTPAMRDVRLDHAIRWLCLAQDRTPDGGVSEGYHLYHGWLPSYPETTGYIIETFWDYHRRVGEASIRERALRMAEWLLAIQHPDGSIPDSYFTRSMVFDTGQVLFGFVRTFEETGDERVREAAVRAGEWLLSVQDDDGAWRSHALHGIPHAYYSRVGWSLMSLYRISGDDRFRSAAMRNGDWTIRQQRPNGWFDQAGFSIDRHPAPFTHTIAYTIRGVLEMGIALQAPSFIEAASKAVAGLLAALPMDALPAGTYDEAWRGDVRFSCLTGNAQLAISIFRLASHQGSRDLYRRGVSINRAMAAVQDIDTADENRRGAIAGSKPVWGKYIHFAYPNWATKFLAESLMTEARVERELGLADADQPTGPRPRGGP